jgi:hypothetical protein
VDPRGRRGDVAQSPTARFAEEWDLDGLVTQMQSLYGTDITVEELREEVDVTTARR